MMSVFFERFVIPLMAAIVVGICFANPLKWKTNVRILVASMAIVIAASASFYIYKTVSQKMSSLKPPSVKGQGGRAISHEGEGSVSLRNTDKGVFVGGQGGEGGSGGDAITVGKGVDVTIINGGIIAGGDAGK
jgi:hypothetical protein